ncbi:hypothetical protein AB0K86_28915 [Streptomyces clavifer]|uniref:hypothetical protein n=1 Tax=Streptomyces TaxID=1883 RepID=UPI0006FE8A34|nr:MULTISPECIES: hypothetical protein [unclassified Streptomyces]KQX91560.1 hypothetical protein ASD26_23770 [Streptomyces sp. Root1319]KQZ20121.1 hypothetical protein ASD51_25300 [Streptomyces sp. Root55]MDX3061182.1 hypothetical protein [Streptomyces sp. ND04-05B]
MDWFRRASAAALLTAVVLAGAVGGATASPGVPAPPSGASGEALPALSAHATARSVGAWEEFRVHGSARHIRPGTLVTLQQKQGERWVSLPAKMTTSSSEYSLRVKLGIKGENSLRIVGGGAVSPVVRTIVG